MLRYIQISAPRKWSSILLGYIAELLNKEKHGFHVCLCFSSGWLLSPNGYKASDTSSRVESWSYELFHRQVVLFFAAKDVLPFGVPSSGSLYFKNLPQKA